MLTQKSYEHLISLLEYYAQTSSGQEQENAEATEVAWNELITLQKPRTLCVEVQGGVVQDVHGLPEGWNYELADWDMLEDADGAEDTEQGILDAINRAKNQ